MGDVPDTLRSSRPLRCLRESVWSHHSFRSVCAGTGAPDPLRRDQSSLLAGGPGLHGTLSLSRGSESKK